MNSKLMKTPNSYLTIITASLSLLVAQTAFTGEWVDLFDGKTLKGWKKSTLGSANYTVVEDTILGETV